MPSGIDKTLDRLVSWNTLKNVGKHVSSHPVKYTVGAGGVLAASDALGPQATDLESEIMRNRLGTPGGKYVFAELEVVEQRKAFLEDSVGFTKSAAGSLGIGPLLESIQGGVGHAVGAASTDLIRGMLGSAISGLSDVVSRNPKRRAILLQILTRDPIVSMYEKQNPGAALKAYASMVNVAPTLSMDPNVVTSFLREAAQTGGSINYMTLKQLAEAENAVRNTAR
jgi:hypothetical protein